MATDGPLTSRAVPLAWPIVLPHPVEPGPVNRARHRVLAGLFVLSLVTAALVLSAVVWTAVLGVTLAYVLIPVVSWLEERGLSRLWASVVATVGGTFSVVSVLVVVSFLVYRRRGAVIDFLESLPDRVTVSALGYQYTAETQTVLDNAVDVLSHSLVAVAAKLPTFSLKLTLFAFVVFGLLVGHRAVEDALMAAVPRSYHDVVGAFARRSRDTLYAIYVLQVATGAATFLFALPVFVGLGYDIPITLSFIAGVLQFLPIVGPSVLLGALAIYHVVVGELVPAVLVVVVGGVIVAWLPDIIVRPQLARRTGRLPGTLYFIGFVGGLLTLGPVGIVAGPLAVALVVEAVSLLEAENEIG